MRTTTEQSITAIGEQVATELTALDPSGPATWTSTPFDGTPAYPMVTLIGPEGITLHLRHGWEGARRYDVTGDLGQEAEKIAAESLLRDQEPKKITMAESKSPKQIAQDIARRFLPAWIEYKATVTERVEKHRAHEAETTDVGNRIVVAFGDADWIDERVRTGEDIEIGRRHDAKLSGRARVIAKDSFRDQSEVVFERLRMSADDAEAFAMWWKERQQGGPTGGGKGHQTFLPMS